MADKKFPEGIKAFKPSDKAPGFIKANIQVSKQELINWLQGQPDTVKLSLKESQKGTYYLEVDTYQANSGQAGNNYKQPANKSFSQMSEDDLPF